MHLTMKIFLKNLTANEKVDDFNNKTLKIPHRENLILYWKQYPILFDLKKLKNLTNVMMMNYSLF